MNDNRFGPHFKEDMQTFRRVSSIYLGAALIIAGVFISSTLAGYDFIGYTFALIGLFLSLLSIFERIARTRPRLGLAAGNTVRLLALLLVIAFIAAESCIIQGSHTDADAGGADYAVVLGAGVNGSVPSLSLKNRLDAALKYLNDNPGTVCVVSGCQGRGEDISEAECMYRWLIERGIEPERVIREERARNTKENILFSYELIDAGSEGGTPSVCLITAEYHLYRARLTARRLGLEATGYAAATTLMPIRTNYFIREFLAVWKLWIFG